MRYNNWSLYHTIKSTDLAAANSESAVFKSASLPPSDQQQAERGENADTIEKVEFLKKVRRISAEEGDGVILFTQMKSSSHKLRVLHGVKVIGGTLVHKNEDVVGLLGGLSNENTKPTPIQVDISSMMKPIEGRLPKIERLFEKVKSKGDLDTVPRSSNQTPKEKILPFVFIPPLLWNTLFECMKKDKIEPGELFVNFIQVFNNFKNFETEATCATATNNQGDQVQQQPTTNDATGGAPIIEQDVVSANETDGDDQGGPNNNTTTISKEQYGFIFRFLWAVNHSSFQMKSISFWPLCDMDKFHWKWFEERSTLVTSSRIANTVPNRQNKELIDLLSNGDASNEQGPMNQVVVHNPTTTISDGNRIVLVNEDKKKGFENLDETMKRMILNASAPTTDIAASEPSQNCKKFFACKSSSQANIHLTKTLKSEFHCPCFSAATGTIIGLYNTLFTRSFDKDIHY